LFLVVQMCNATLNSWDKHSEEFTEIEDRLLSYFGNEDENHLKSSRQVNPLTMV